MFKKINLLLVFTLVLLVSPFVFSQEENEITLTVEFPSLQITPKGDNYYSLHMKDAWNYGAPGEPVLPVKTVKILIPEGKIEEIDKIFIELGNKVIIQGSYLIEPGQKPVTLSYKGPVQLTLPDARIYTSNTVYPLKVFSEPFVQWLEGMRILIINLYPVSYVPTTGEVSYYKNVTIRIPLATTITPLSGHSMFRGQRSKNRARNFVDNPGVVETYSSIRPLSRPLNSRLLAGGPYRYVIITSAALEGAAGPNNFQALRDAKIAQGMTATIVTTEYIYATYDGIRPDGGTDNQTKIRNFIIDAYQAPPAGWGTEYVLLGGDADGEDVDAWEGYGVDESETSIVPVRKLWAMDCDYDEGDNIPSDMYYSCLDGTFDADADGIYGEYPEDNPDFTAEVYVGRACVDSAAELSNFVVKTLHYEATTDPYLLTARMVGEQLDILPTWGGDCKDEVKNSSDANGYTTVGFPGGTIATETLYDRDYTGRNWPSSDIIDVINDKVHLINHLGHGDNVYCMKMKNWQPYYSDVDDLTNTEFFIGYSQACYSGAFDNWYAAWEYIPYDCILEHFTTEAHGAVAFVGNSRYGWYNPGGTNGPSQRFDREFWDALFGEDIFELGKMNADSKEDNIGYMNSSAYGRWCAYELNLFGDPALSVRLVTSAGKVFLDRDDYPVPATVNVTVWDSDLKGAGTITVEVTSVPTADTENVTLTETGASTGVFAGSIDLEIDVVSVGNGTLEVAIGDTITVTYIDANDGAGHTDVIVTDTATVILMSAPTGLTATAGRNYVFLYWNPVQSPVLDRYNVYRSTSLTGTKTKVNGTNIVKNTSYSDLYLSLNTTYYYWVTAVDTYGNETDYSSSVMITTTTGGSTDDGDGGGGGGAGSLGCFIATASYGTPMAEEVKALSQFRDEYLLSNSLGRIFIDAYYKVSPPIASFISEHPYLKKLVRCYLKPVVKVADKILQE